jgi:lysophospholipase L1-like esterase
MLVLRVRNQRPAGDPAFRPNRSHPRDGRIAAVPIVLLALLGLLATPASADPAPLEIGIGKVRLAPPLGGRAALLVPVRYPVQLLGQRVELRVTVGRRGARVQRSWTLRGRAHGGALRTPERRRRFTFVHGIRLGRALSRRVRPGVRVDVVANEALDLNRDGTADLAGGARSVQRLPRGYPRRLCADVPLLRTGPGRTLRVRLPSCGSRVRWRVERGSLHGRARIRNGRLAYRPPARFRGAETIVLHRRLRGVRSSARRAALTTPVRVAVGAGASPSVRAIGDSVTAGFGYYSDGRQMQFTSLPSCKPGEKAFDDACSSNSIVTDNTTPQVEYAPDYGLSNNVSWVAQWANEHGVTDFANYAVSGSEPKNWIPGGQLHATTRRVAEEDPDYILMTIGANPLLSEMLFGVDKMGCAIWSDVEGRYRECIEEAFAGVQLDASLRKLYAELVGSTAATIYLMQYHLSVPSVALAYSATQIATMGALLNERIAKVAAEVDPARLLPIAPPHFDVGIDISPAYPSTHSCSSLGYLVDGRSVQSDPTQDELRVLHPLSFCPGPAEGPPWVIGGDTGIHPSAAGYAQMAAQLPPPRD